MKSTIQTTQNNQARNFLFTTWEGGGNIAPATADMEL
jgi:hypothetical protein